MNIKRSLKSNCEDIPIKSLNVDESCLDGMRRLGFRDARDLIEFFERIPGNPGKLSTEFITCIPEFVAQLKAVGCWPEYLEDIEKWL